jgi:hypothetical protein
VAGLRYQAVLAVIEDGVQVTEAAAKAGGTRFARTGLGNSAANAVPGAGDAGGSAVRKIAVLVGVERLARGPLERGTFRPQMYFVRAPFDPGRRRSGACLRLSQHLGLPTSRRLQDDELLRAASCRLCTTALCLPTFRTAGTTAHGIRRVRARSAPLGGQRPCSTRPLRRCGDDGP